MHYSGHNNLYMPSIHLSVNCPPPPHQTSMLYLNLRHKSTLPPIHSPSNLLPPSQPLRVPHVYTPNPVTYSPSHFTFPTIPRPRQPFHMFPTLSPTCQPFPFPPWLLTHSPTFSLPSYPPSHLPTQQSLSTQPPPQSS